LQLPLGHATIQRALTELLHYIVAFAESVEFEEETGIAADNSDLFDRRMAPWARKYKWELNELAEFLEEEKHEFIGEVAR
jgi:hypothetical protein